VRLKLKRKFFFQISSVVGFSVSFLDDSSPLILSHSQSSSAFYFNLHSFTLIDSELSGHFLQDLSLSGRQWQIDSRRHQVIPNLWVLLRRFMIWRRVRCPVRPFHPNGLLLTLSRSPPYINHSRSPIWIRIPRQCHSLSHFHLSRRLLRVASTPSVPHIPNTTPNQTPPQHRTRPLNWSARYPLLLPYLRCAFPATICPPSSRQQRQQTSTAAVEPSDLRYQRSLKSIQFTSNSNQIKSDQLRIQFKSFILYNTTYSSTTTTQHPWHLQTAALIRRLLIILTHAHSHYLYSWSSNEPIASPSL
jgi:hypothetical protein